MDKNDTVTPEQQSLRRKRIDRIKIGIILTIFIWIVVSMIAIVVLAFKLVHLNRRVNQLSACMKELDTSENDGSGQDSEDSENSEESQAVQTDATPGKQIVTGIDTPDNMAAEGDEHLVYLTFDGSPSLNTEAILDTLQEYDVKATFFVVGNETEGMQPVYRRIVEDGHTLGMHSYSNQYSKVYASAEAFMEDYTRLSDYLEIVTGIRSRYYRFPGGSGNGISNVDMVDLVRLLNEENTVYFDWNVSGGDALADCTAEEIVSNVTEGVLKYKTAVVLLHDSDNRSATVAALGPLIEALQQSNARILPIDENTKVIQYIKADSVE